MKHFHFTAPKFISHVFLLWKKQSVWRIARRAGEREISLVLHLRVRANMGKLLQLCRFSLRFPTSEMRQYLGDDLYVSRPSAGSCFLNMLSCWSKHMNVGYWKSIITYLRARDVRVDDISTSNLTGLELVLQTVLTWRGKAQWERGSHYENRKQLEAIHELLKDQ